MNFAKLAVVAAVSLGVAGPALAGGFGIDFVGEDPNNKVDTTDKAGIPEVAQANWNALQVSRDDPNGRNNSGVLISVVDQDGNAVDGVTVTVKAEQGKVWPKNGASWGFSGANAKLQQGFIWPQFRITVNDIPYDKYDVYVYAGAGDNAGGGKVTISVANNAEGAVDANSTKFYRLTWLDGRFVRSDATTIEDAKSKNGNYIVFTGNTAKDIAIDWDGTVDAAWTGCSAIQIVEVKD